MSSDSARPYTRPGRNKSPAYGRSEDVAAGGGATRSQRALKSLRRRCCTNYWVPPTPRARARYSNKIIYTRATTIITTIMIIIII